MSDSVDRVFAHALHTVKRIPRTGSARPPPSDRLKLYGLYKQSTEGDVDSVMSRPRGDSDETRSDQEKWDAWNQHKGLSRTEAKRQYISTLIETMHRYASQTADARELVSELEFVWDQIKSNPPSTSSSNSYPRQHGSGNSPTSNRDQLIYPAMSKDGARNPGHTRRRSLRAIDPISQHSSEQAGDDGENPEEEDGKEEFVDAQDSQLDEHDNESPERPKDISKRARNFGREAGAIIAPIAKYWTSQRKDKHEPVEDANAKWQRRVESALIKMNAEMAALREQLEMQHEVMMSSSILGPFKVGRRRTGVVRWVFEFLWASAKTVLKHVLVDAMIVALITLWMNHHGVPAEKLERVIVGWVHQLRRITFIRRLERTAVRQIPQSMQVSLSDAARFRSMG